MNLKNKKQNQSKLTQKTTKNLQLIAAIIPFVIHCSPVPYTQKQERFRMLKIEVADNNIPNARMQGLELGSICIKNNEHTGCIKNIVEEKVLTYQSQSARNIFGNEDARDLIDRSQKISCSNRSDAVALGMNGYVVVTFEKDIVSGDIIDIDVVEPAPQGCSNIKIPYILSGINEKGIQKTICKGESNQTCKVK